MNISQYISENYLNIIFIVSVLLGAFFLTRLTRFLIGRFITSSSLVLKSNPTNFRFLRNSISVLVYMMAFLVIIYNIPGGQTLAVSLFAGAGVFAAILGFASQAAFSNIISGIFIVIFKPFRVEDIIQVGDSSRGTVEDITLRHVVIRDYENKRIIIPNTIISEQTIVNFTIRDEKLCRHIEIPVSFESDLDKAKKIIREVAEGHPFCIDNRTPEEVIAGSPVVDVRVVRFEEYYIVLKAWVWSNDPTDSFYLMTEVLENVKKQFEKEGITIPYPYRNVIIKEKSADS